MDLREVPRAPFRRHPWEVSRARFFRRELGGALGGRGAVRVLDVGAGDGYFAGELLESLPPGSRVTCVDAHYRDGDLAAPARAGVTRARTPPPGERFDALLLLDVIEHVPDDLAFVRGLVEGSLAPGARALVSVPAWQALFTDHDVKLGHYRRYTPAQCRGVLERAGLTVVRSGGLFHSLLVPRALSRAKEALAGRKSAASAGAANGDAATEAGAWTAGDAITKAIDVALAADNQLSHALAARGLPLPGLSFWALCER